MPTHPFVVPVSIAMLALLLAGCQRNEPPPTVIVAPGPAGEPGPAGATGEAGKPGTNTTVIVAPLPASAASV